jgi:hypothetical protein
MGNLPVHLPISLVVKLFLAPETIEVVGIADDDRRSVLGSAVYA